jgi:hypothetical protein
VENMSKFKKVVAALASVLIFSISGVGQAQAAEIAITGTTDWLINEFTGEPPVEVSDSYRLNGSYTVDVTDYQATIDFFTLYLNGVQVGITSPFANNDESAGTPEEGFNNPSFSSGTFQLSSGLLTIFTRPATGASEGGNSAVRFSKFVSRSSNALRLDTPGTTTEKSNVVSCTPGKYTFLNGGSTPEAANIQSYVYTLLVNGKALSTLSTDSFKSVASHMFPTIAGNMAGTATLDGASWDLKGMSNYSAQCQVYATQSGGNIQSVTTTTHDAVALAAAAEAAAKVQMAKDMIANWNSSNEALAKKSRDARLAGRP